MIVAEMENMNSHCHASVLPGPVKSKLLKGLKARYDEAKEKELFFCVI